MVISNDILIKAVNGKSLLMKFINFPYAHYRNSLYWVAPLKTQQADIFNKKKNPFFQTSEMELFLAIRNNKVVGRIAAIENKVHNLLHKDKVGFFGFFECTNDREVCNALLNAAEKWLQARKLLVMRGPFSPTMNQESGFLIEGFDDPPRLMMPYNYAYYPDLIQSAGLNRCKQLLAYKIISKEVASNEKIVHIANLIKNRYNVTLRQVDMKRFSEEIGLIADIYNKCWASNWGFVPISSQDALLMAKSLKPIVEPSLIQIAEINKHAVGMIVTLYDFNEILMKMKGKLWPFGVFRLFNAKKRITWLRMMLIGVIPEYRKKGIDGLLYHAASVNACKLGKDICEGSWTLEDNEEINRIALMMGGMVYKKYNIYEKNI